AQHRVVDFHGTEDALQRGRGVCHVTPKASQLGIRQLEQLVRVTLEDHHAVPAAALGVCATCVALPPLGDPPADFVGVRVCRGAPRPPSAASTPPARPGPRLHHRAPPTTAAAGPHIATLPGEPPQNPPAATGSPAPSNAPVFHAAEARLPGGACGPTVAGAAAN